MLFLKCLFSYTWKARWDRNRIFFMLSYYSQVCQSLKLQLGLPHGGKGPNTSAICCFPKCFSRELDQKWSVWPQLGCCSRCAQWPGLWQAGSGWPISPITLNGMWGQGQNWPDNYSHQCVCKLMCVMDWTWPCTGWHMQKLGMGSFQVRFLGWLSNQVTDSKLQLQGRS